MKKRLLLVIVALVGLSVLVWTFFPQARAVLSSATSSLGEYTKTTTDSISATITPITTPLQELLVTLQPVAEFAADTIYPMVAGVATQSGVLELNQVTIDPAEISTALEDLPNQPAKQALYQYCQQIVQDYEAQTQTVLE